MRLRQISVVLAGAFAVLAALFVGPAQGATDTTPPAWTKAPTNAMVLGAQVNPAIPDDCDSWKMPVKVSWAAKDPESGIAHYGSSPSDFGPEDADLTSKTSLTETAWVNDDACGGGGLDQNFYAFNGAGLSVSYYWSDQILNVVQDDSLTQSFDQPWIKYNGVWGTSACNCWSGGTTQKTTQSGASGVLSLPYDPFYQGRDYGIGLVMAKGPDRGKAAVFVDNVKVATVDTHTTSKVNRTIVWRQTVSSDTHTIKVVNLATAGHARIDIDAFVLLNKEG